MEFFSKLTVCICLFIIFENTGAQWSEWSSCVVYRERYRDCPTGNCVGNNFSTDSINYTTCPMISPDDVIIIKTQIETTKQQQISEIKNNTQNAINQIQTTYKSSIEASSGFGYIAIIFICIIFFMPLMGDMARIIKFCMNRKKVQNSDQYNNSTEKNKNKNLKQNVQH